MPRRSRLMSRRVLDRHLKIHVLLCARTLVDLAVDLLHCIEASTVREAIQKCSLVSRVDTSCPVYQ